jgi:hypothetical protein
MGRRLSYFLTVHGESDLPGLKRCRHGRRPHHEAGRTGLPEGRGVPKCPMNGYLTSGVYLFTLFLGMLTGPF